MPRDNTKRRAGGLEGHVANWKTWIFQGKASCTGRAGRLHYRTGQWAAHWGGLQIKLGCRKGRAGGLPFSAVQPVLFRITPDRPFEQPASPPFCLLWSPPKIHVFHLETRPSSPPGPQTLQLVLSQKMRCNAKHESQTLRNSL